MIPLGTVGTLSSGEYYRTHNDFSLDQDQVPDTFALSGTFRLNPFLFSTFSGANGNDGFLCRQNCPSHLPEAEQWKEADQVVATRTIKGKYGDDRVEYTLLPKDGTNLDMATIAPRDSLVRKSKILGALPSAGGTQPYILFGENTHPFDQNATSPLNIISNNEYQLRQLGNFSSLLTSSKVRNSYLSFSLVNHLRSQGKNLYPFLEYAFETVDGSKIADRFYTLQGQGKVGQYHVKLQVKKPTLEQPALGNFTIIF